MDFESMPNWILDLEEEDITFIKKFILSSGSLKELANIYNVTYPTVRLRLDKLIQKLQFSERGTDQDQFITFIKKLAINEKFDITTAKILIAEYKKVNKES